MFEWTLFVVLAAVAALIMLAVASADVTGDGVLGGVVVLGLSAYCYIDGRRGLRYGYNHRDRVMLLFGELLGAAILVGVLLQPFVP